MAAYGALVSVMQIIDQLHHHPRPPISIHKQHIESLTANLTFLQEFLESYHPHGSYTSEADPLESRIAEAAYAAEDAIESYIVDQIHAQYNNGGERISSVEFYKGLEKVIEEMNVIKLEMKEMMKDKKHMGVQIIKKKSTTDAGSSVSSSNAQKVGMVGFDDVLYQMLDKLTGGERVRQIIPIVGMGGLGKTTLARNIYENPLIKENFHIRAWSTISQVHDARKILSEILDQVGLGSEGGLSEGDLGVKLYQHLMGRRYLIVMDDMWSIEAWDVVRKYFPENENGSRVVVTTRLSNLASMFNPSNSLDMKLMDEASSWNLFSRTVFGEEIFPPELEEIGKKIVKGCRGLPLSIVVAGGLLSKSETTRENWEVIEGNLSSVVNSEDEESCLQILYTSYNNLPVHLKPCFLYMGASPEDEEIEVISLVQLLVAEGIIKPIDGKSLEEAGTEYLKELQDRNLLLVEGDYQCGDVKSYKIHDLLRDLSLREAGKVKFLCALEEQSIHELRQGISSQRRITGKLRGEHRSDPLILQSLKSASLVRTSFLDSGSNLSFSYRLLRVLMEDHEVVSGQDSEQIFVPPVNLRLLFGAEITSHLLLRSPHYPLYFLWNLQCLYLCMGSDEYSLELQRLPLLRFLVSYDGSLSGECCLPDYDPLSGDHEDEVVLESLHTLWNVSNLRLGEGVLRTIPNVKRLKLSYTQKRGDYCLNNLHRLNELQDLLLCWNIWDPSSMQDLILPYSLRELTLYSTYLPWEEMASKIGCLPLLQILKLEPYAFVGSEWETVEGQFSSLKFLEIERCRDLVHWTTESTHFPCLERLVLSYLSELSEVPSSIGDIPTLKSITLKDCSDSAVESARIIQEEQDENGNKLLLQIQDDD